MKKTKRNSPIHGLRSYSFLSPVHFSPLLSPQLTPPRSPGGTGPVYEFNSVEGADISELLTDYAMGLLRELGVQAAREQEMQNEKEGAARAVQAAFRGHILRKRMAQDMKLVLGSMSKLMAATKLQAAWRGHQTRDELKEERAVLLVQSVFRGYQARVQFDMLISKQLAELEDLEEAEEMAATALQAAFRGFRVRKQIDASIAEAEAEAGGVEDEGEEVGDEDDEGEDTVLAEAAAGAAEAEAEAGGDADSDSDDSLEEWRRSMLAPL